MNPCARAASSLALAIAMLAGIPASGAAARIDDRTLLLSGLAFSPFADGDAANAQVGPDGRFVVFDTSAVAVVADDANGSVRDVVLLDAATGERRLVSVPNAGGAADGPSSDGAPSANGTRVAFTSAAGNLVAGDTNGVTDVFVRDRTGATAMASVTPDGRPGNRPSSNADLSANGRFLVFESEASDLVIGDSNGQRDVFLRDLEAGITIRASVDDLGRQATGPSSNPAISADGLVVAFESSARNLVADDTNRTADIFVRDLRADLTERVSIDSDGGQQDRSVTKPFRMVPDLDAHGWRVVFDSEATNLAPGDVNARADVFLHDRRTRRTRIVSANSANVQGNNDSVSPAITPSGRYLTFQSYASNLAPRDSTGPDIFVRDLELRATTQVSVAADGAKRQAEVAGKQVLQRPSISDDGMVAAFVSSAPNLVTTDTDALVDVFVRRLVPATTAVVQRVGDVVKFGADDPQATRFLCRVDRRTPFPCGPGVSVAQGGRSMLVRAMGPGLLPDPDGALIKTRGDRRRPSVRITTVPRRRSERVVAGTAGDRGSGIERVEFALIYSVAGDGCRVLDRGVFRRARSCKERRYTAIAGGPGRWSVALGRRLPRGFIGIYARAVDRAGNRSRTTTRIILLRR